MKNYKVVVNGKEYEVSVEEAAAGTKPVETSEAAPVKPVSSTAGAGAGVNTITAPMPGTAINVGCHPGDKVSKGDILIVLEAMKMENEIMAPHDGTVTEVRVQQGLQLMQEIYL